MGSAGFDLGFEAAGFSTLFMAEFDPTPISATNPNPRPLEQQYNNRVLAKRFPGVPNLGDVNRIESLPAVDVLTFGSPCQDLSVAGQRAGLEGSRSSLFFEACRLIQQCRPAFAIWENVPGAFSSNSGRDFRAVLSTLADLGATDIAWRVFDSRYSGVPQRRRRLYLVADFGGRRAGAILFETTRCSGHPAPGQETWQSFASTLTGGARGAGRPGGSHDSDLVEGPHPAKRLVAHDEEEVSKSLGSNATGGFRFDLDHDTYVTEEISKSLLGNSVRNQIEANYIDQRDYSDPVTSKWAKGAGGPAGDEIQNLAPLAIIQDARNMAHKGQKGAGISEGDVAYTLDVMNTQAVAFEPRIARGKGGRIDDQSPALTADSDRGDGQPMVMTVDHDDVARAVELPTLLAAMGLGGGAKQAPHVIGPRIRRFTPTETERLQGFPPGWTCLCGAEADMFACTCPDGPRYRATGNAVTVTVTTWLARRCRAALEGRINADGTLAMEGD